MADDAEPYQPRPIDTSSVRLDESLERALEPLARNVHELWAAQRAAEGWVYGPERDQVRKTHPGLVPFDQLDDAEKHYDRLIASQTLLALRAQGFEVIPTRTARGFVTPDGGDATFGAEVDAVRRVTASALAAADEQALRLRRRYRALALISSILGTAAVLLAIGQLFLAAEHEQLRSILFAAEFICAAAAVFGVGYGLRSSFHHHWLVARHKTERLRALQAEGMMRVLAGRFDPAQLAPRVAEVEGITFPAMHAWLKRDLVPVPVELAVSNASPGRVTAFVRTYLSDRLAPQADYLMAAEAREDARDRRTRRLPPLLFFLSIACVFLHAGLHPFREVRAAEASAHVALLLAASLPVLASGLRTYREAVQMSRNASRFASKAAALDLLRNELSAAQTSSAAIATTWHVEQVLESEHREWLRLMIDAEWFG